MYKVGIDIGASNVKLAILNNDKIISKITKKVDSDLSEIIKSLCQEQIKNHKNMKFKFGVTGIGKDILETSNPDSAINEVMATTEAVTASHPECRTVIDLGGEFTKWIQLSKDGKVESFSTNGLCAAGAGAFLEQQAGRLRLEMSELSKIAESAEKGAPIAGRCSVFAKSDMIHLQQKGTPVEEIAYGLCLALIRTFSATVIQGRKLVTPVVLAGGGANNKGLVRAVYEIFSLKPDEMIIPEDQMYAGAIGAAMLAPEQDFNFKDLIKLVDDYENRKSNELKLALSKLGPYDNNSIAKIEKPKRKGKIKDAYLGLDVGSVSTNLVLMDEKLNLVHGIYLPTKGRPVEVIREGLKEIEDLFGKDINIKGCGATGSGRHLAAALIGADVVKNEITAQMTSSAYYFPDADTIFEIGGQDSKYISMNKGKLVDFEMNKICAAGTGSFLEEQATRLGINIIHEFGELASKGAKPADLGSQCTVFMDSELVSAQRKGDSLENLCAGLSYSVVRNYLEKVVAHRTVGKHIVFQGGTASNKAVVSAFEHQLGRKVSVHPYNRISGAIGSAILAARSQIKKSSFRGFGDNRPVKVLTFECKSCSNLCQVSRLQIGEDTAWFGDACDKYANKTKDGSVAHSADDIIPIREKLLASVMPNIDQNQDREKIGLITGSLSRELMPLWSNLIWELGFEPVFPDDTSGKTLRNGVKKVPSEVCMPLKIVAGQADDLLNNKGATRVFMPSVTELPAKKTESLGIKNLPDTDLSAVCIFTQQIPFMLKRQHGFDNIIAPQFTLEKYSGSFVEAINSLTTEFKTIPRSKIKSAFEKAYKKYSDFVATRRNIGKSLIEANKEKAIVLMGKPYNMYDSYLNMGLINHLTKMGYTVIPMDFLPLEDIVLDAGSSRIPWVFNRDFLRVAKFVNTKDNLFPLLVSNFGCGPDTFALKHLETMWNDKPFMALEFDEQRGEAGMVTRLEAFSDEIEEHLKHKPEPASEPKPVFYRTNNRINRFFVPHLGAHTIVYSGLLKSLKGPEVIKMDEPDMISIRMGEEISSGRECHPYTILGGDIMRVEKDFHTQKGDAIFFMSTINPCLLSQYGDGYRLALRKMNSELEIMDFNASEMWDLLGYHRLRLLMEGLAAVDSISILRYRFRPYEKEKGMVDSLMDEALIDIENGLVEQKSPFIVLKRTLNKLRSFDFGSYVRRPVVGLTGDMYTRIVANSNGKLIERLEDMGCEVYQSPFMAGLLQFSNHSDSYLWASRGEATPVIWETLAMVSSESMLGSLKKILGDDFGPICMEPDYKDMIKMVKPYVGERSNYLITSTIGKFVDFAKRGVDGVISAIGINCMVGIASGSAMGAIREDNNNIPMITLAYGGEEGVVQRLKLETFVHQVKEFSLGKSGLAKPMGLLADK